MDGVKNEGAKKKKVFQNHRYCQLCLESELSVNGVVCVFGAHFRSSGTLESS